MWRQAHKDPGTGREVRMALDVDLAAHVAAMQGTVAEGADVIAGIVRRLTACLADGGKLLVCGNGGSAADAQHFAAEFMNRMRFDRRAWPAIALTTDTSVLTSIANDSDYEQVFARQVDALGHPGDTLIALSTSGASANVLAALRAARRRGMVTIGFTGEAGADPMRPSCDLVLVVPSRDTARIQECHEFVYHVVAEQVERELLQPEGTHAPQ
jgi:D-sedoheptulose 7-phosphate isomerase